MVRFERRRFGRFSRKIDIPKPVKVGEEYNVEINEVGSRGDGIARIKNFVVFVPDTKKGDKPRIKITEVRNRFAIGEKVEAKQEAPEEAKAEEELPEERVEEIKLGEVKDVTEEEVAKAKEEG